MNDEQRLLEEYEQQYKRANSGRRIRVIKVGDDQYQFCRGDYRSTDTYNLEQIKLMIKNLKQRVV